MTTFKKLTGIWNNVREVELKPIAAEAQREVRIAIVGQVGSGRHTLASQMRSDPQRANVVADSPLLILETAQADPALPAHLIILVLDATQKNFHGEWELARKWTDQGKKVLVFFNKLDLLPDRQIIGEWSYWGGLKILHGSAIHTAFLQREFVAAVLGLLPDFQLTLGRHYPLFRATIANDLINESCLSNAAYALSTGLAETVPVLDIPLNIADMFVLTKAQAFLVYRLGLVLGFSTRWQDYITEFSSVIGSGFIWRQAARMLIGLIPVWGIAPKVAISYTGTYVVGHMILQWYLTGRHISREQINAIYRQALERGRNVTRRLMERIPRPRWQFKLPAAKSPKALPAPSQPKRKPRHQTCPYCHKTNAGDASFCQYCGQGLVVTEIELSPGTPSSEPTETSLTDSINPGENEQPDVEQDQANNKEN